MGAAALVALVTVLALTSDNVERETVVSSCERVNLLRQEVNRRGDVLREFLVSAAQVRDDTAALQTGLEADLNRAAARRWRLLARSITDVPVPDCEKVVESAAPPTYARK